MGKLSYSGELDISDAFPVLKLVGLQIQSFVGLMLPQLLLELQLLAKLTINPWPSISASIALATRLLLNLRIALDLPALSIDLGVGVLLKLKLIKAAIEAALGWGLYPGAVHVFLYQGKAGQLGTSINGGQLGNVPRNRKVLAVFLVASMKDPRTIQTLRTVLKVNMPSVQVRLT
jgi:hypothetical protein